MPWLLQDPKLAAALAWPGQAQGAMQLETLLCLHRGKNPNLQIFFVKEEKSTKAAKFLPSEGNQSFSMCFRVFSFISPKILH